ncbi:MAG: oligopeptide transporter, OPT family [Prevotella sp.]|jgi:putative OPT family oligopeptide transporter|nr:oligopeptide transporter, OPT family [Prevotella sp.]MCH3969526.1 oligopeptide transporter, OPT family [Prevotella sp.]MCH3992901.1 oligopeptide transporter, OPT family [Prevotella sp.]MCI1350103.1 oligopeptide transporter, OPT family [Prevotella sp.]MCI1473499.1 oligopeptide transporter, OPT family [Prevotella sp.]MCI1518577.1 oligopeptide transporter, OPT family [Prevotella sp.]
MEYTEKEKVELPENAFRELKRGEEYTPIMKPNKVYPEVNAWSVTWGILMAILFSAAAAYLGLKVGQVFEAAIPIAIIAVGVSTAAKRKNSLGENVIIQSIGACSGAVVAGAIFTLPAIYILQAKYPAMTTSFLKVFMASALGGILGILFLIPFRKYFVSDMHGKYPFPEATATTQVLVSGAKGGGQAKPLLQAGIVGGLYDFIVSTFGWWNENFTSRVIGIGQVIADKAKLVFKVNTGAAVLGLGYIVGLRYALFICLGSAAVWWLIVPGMGVVFHNTVLNMWDPSITVTVGAMSPEEIFRDYGRSIGIGGIAMAGILGIIKSWKIIKGAVSLAGRELKGKNSGNVKVKRTQRDISFKIIIIGTVVTLLVTFGFFLFGVMHGNFLFAAVGILLVAIIAFLFTTVAANAIAIVGSNPVSGMTLMTLILASVVMVAVGLKGPAGMLAALLMGGVVCTALSMAGSFITDLKIGYWMGTTPKKQETWKFLGTLVSAATVGGVMMLLNQTYGFTSGKLAAPQANAMAAVIDPLMNGVGAPWLLYAIGAVIAIILDRCHIPALAFALGMFIPLQLNLPLLVGGLLNWYVTSRSKDKAINKARGERGTLLASGFIAGGALMGVVSALLTFFGAKWSIADTWWTNPLSEFASLVAYILLIIYFVKAAKRGPEDLDR